MQMRKSVRHPLLEAHLEEGALAYGQTGPCCSPLYPSEKLSPWNVAGAPQMSLHGRVREGRSEVLTQLQTRHQKESPERWSNPSRATAHVCGGASTAPKGGSSCFPGGLTSLPSVC